MGCGVWGVGFRVCCLGFGVWGLGFGVWGWEFGIGGSGVWVLGAGFRICSLGFGVLGGPVRFRVARRGGKGLLIHSQIRPLHANEGNQMTRMGTSP